MGTRSSATISGGSNGSVESEFPSIALGPLNRGVVAPLSSSRDNHERVAGRRGGWIGLRLKVNRLRGEIGSYFLMRDYRAIEVSQRLIAENEYVLHGNTRYLISPVRHLQYMYVVTRRWVLP